MTKYSLSVCEKLIDDYVNKYNGEVTTLEEGCLGLGLTLLHHAKGMKTIVIQEKYESSFHSSHTVRQYNKIPKKYERLLNEM
jgi:hypothetical protein